MEPDHSTQQPPSGTMYSDDQHNRGIQCDCCFEIVSRKKTVQLPGCGHKYCADCLRVIYRMAISNEAHFPPSCCSGAIDINSVKHLLHRPQVTAYEKCAAEYSTPVLVRRYCADTRCNSFLGRANGGILRCDKCGNLTCDVCKDHAHPGVCKEERGRDVHKLDADLERLATAEGWQRCPACSRMVVLGGGCNHMTCRCKHEFCYLCGAKWKTCTCQQWQEDHLQERLRQEDQEAYHPLPVLHNDLDIREQIIQLQEELLRIRRQEDPFPDFLARMRARVYF